MSNFKKLTDKEIAALSAEAKASYEKDLAQFEQSEKEAKEKADADKKEKAEAKKEEKEAKTMKGWETSDGYQFPVKNDAENHARSLPEGEREIEECTIKL